MKRQPTAVQSKWVTALKVCVCHVHIKSQMLARGRDLITIIGSKLQNKCERVQKGSLPCSVWHPCQSHSPDVLLSILSYHPNTFGLTIIYLFFFFSVLSISTLTLSHQRGQITVLMFDLKGKEEEVVAVLSVNLKLSWRHFILFYFFSYSSTWQQKTASAPQVTLFHFEMTFLSGVPAQCCRWRSPPGCCFLGPPRGVVSHRREAPARIFQTGAAWMHGGIWFPMWAPNDRSDLEKFYGLWSSGVFWK